jgi:dipeptidyl-peptidase-4
MGPLPENEEAYIEGSPITHAHKLEGNLLLIHGTADDNVHYQCFERLVNELIKHNKQFSTMVYPNRTHAIKEGKNTSLHLHDLMTRYLVEHLL